MITVAQLIHMLSFFPANAIVVVEQDKEGNVMSLAGSNAQLGQYVPQAPWCGVFESEDDLALCTEDERAVLEGKAFPAVCLGPLWDTDY